MALYHFSHDPGIEVFEPRPVRVPSRRPPGREWLNGPLVWAIDDRRQPMYLFPRDCPRILWWLTPTTTAADRARWWDAGDRRMVACIEAAWSERVRTAEIYRYELPPEPFIDLDDAGMWVSRETVVPLHRDRLTDLPAELDAQQVSLRTLAGLAPLREMWATSLHVSGIRLRNAAGWA